MSTARMYKTRDEFKTYMAQIMAERLHKEPTGERTAPKAYDRSYCGPTLENLYAAQKWLLEQSCTSQLKENCTPCNLRYFVEDAIRYAKRGER